MLVLEYKIKAKPNQYRAIEEAIRTVQFVRNKCLRYWIDSPREAKVNYAALSRYSTELRNEFKFVKDLNSMAVQASAERTWLAISRFYDNCKAKKSGKKGYPRFQKDNRSVEYKTSGWKLDPTKRRITITDKKGIGDLKVLGKWDIYTYPVKSIKRVRLVRRADGYYCQFCIDVECVDIQPKTGNEIGLDVGLESFYTDSNGHHEPNPKFLRKAESDIKHAQRRIYKKEKGSKNRRKARGRYAKKHLRVNRQRNEHACRLARCVVQSNDLIAYEDLRIANLVKCHNRAKSIADASWYQFRLWIEHFAKKFGKTAIAVPPHNTSQECCVCGKKVQKELKVRIHSCTCGLIIHRDINAAINILLKAKSTVGQTGSNDERSGRLYSDWSNPVRASVHVEQRIPAPRLSGSVKTCQRMITGVNHITLSVLDLEQSFKFYTDVLSCKPVARWKRGAYLLAGNLWLCLSLDEQTRKEPLPEYTHIALDVLAENFEELSRQIVESGATIWKKNTSEGASLYFLDPDGHKLELHSANLQARLEATKEQPYEEMEFFDLDR